MHLALGWSFLIYGHGNIGERLPLFKHKQKLWQDV